MNEAVQEPVFDPWIRPATLPPFAYDPRFHSRNYVEAYLDRVDATDEEADEVLSRAVEIERQAVALGYELAEAEHGLDEATGTHGPRFTPPGAPFR
jgi:hypothetical protein